MRNFQCVVLMMCVALSAAASHAAEQVPPRERFVRDRFFDLAQLDALRVDGLTRGEAYQKWGHRVPEYWAHQERLRREFRRAGLEMWQQYPQLRGRADWLARTVENPPFFWKDPQLGARAWAENRRDEVEIDFSERERWEQQYLVLRAQCLTDPQVPVYAKEFIRRVEFNGIVAAAENTRVAREELLAMSHFRVANAIWDFYETREEEERMPIPVSFMFQNLEASRNIGLQHAYLTALTYHPNRKMREFGMGRLNVLELLERPLEGEFPSLSGGKIDLKESRGKVVVIEQWANNCSACVDGMPRMQYLHEKYREHGFEVVGFWFDDIEAPALREKARSVARRLLRKQGATYANAAIMGEECGSFSRKYANTGFPVTWLLDRTGRLVTTGHRDLEAQIRQALGLPPMESASVRWEPPVVDQSHKEAIEALRAEAYAVSQASRAIPAGSK